MAEVTSWFVDQTKLPASEPKRVFTIGTSDYSIRVKKWPKVKRTINKIEARTLTVNVINTDGELNNFFENTYTLPNCCQLKMGFTHPDSGDELISLFTGHLDEVKYKANKTIDFKIKDRL